MSSIFPVAAAPISPTDRSPPLPCFDDDCDAIRFVYAVSSIDRSGVVSIGCVFELEVDVVVVEEEEEAGRFLFSVDDISH